MKDLLVLILLLMSLSVNAQNIVNEQNLFSADELKKLKVMKTSKKVLINNNQALHDRHIQELYRSQLFIMSKMLQHQDQKTDLKTKLKLNDDHILFNELVQKSLLRPRG